MDLTSKDLKPESNNIIFGHTVCQTRDAKWLCVEKIYQKFHRPNFYDIGGTYIQDVADFWFFYKTERVGDIFLLHLFITNRQEGSFSVGVSYDNEMTLSAKNGTAHLTTSLKEFTIKKQKDVNQHYLTTYNFSDLDINALKNKKLYIAVSFSGGDKDVAQDVIDNIKLSHDFGALLIDPIGSDFTIESSDGQKFNVHKALLSAQSEVFKAMLKEDTAESQNSYVKLVDVSSDDLLRILEFIYTGTLKDLDSCNFFNLLMLADQYNVTGLRDLSQYALSQQLSIDNALEILVVADMYNSQILKTASLKFIKKNVNALQSSTFKEINNAALVRELCEYLVPVSQ